MQTLAEVEYACGEQGISVVLFAGAAGKQLQPSQTVGQGLSSAND